MTVVMLRCARSVLADEAGATALEYGMLAAGILVAIAVGVYSVSTVAQSLWSVVFTNISAGF